MNIDDSLPIKEVVAERLKWRAVVPVSVEILREPYGLEFFGDQVRFMVEVHLLSREVRTEVEYTMDVPTSWFQHLKLAILPGWLARWFPPRVNTIPMMTKHYHNCPHLDVPRNGSAHLHWLADPEDCARLRAVATAAQAWADARFHGRYEAPQIKALLGALAALGGHDG